MLQRVPPDMRILTPGRRFFSSSTTRAPRSAAAIAAQRPAAPAPRIATSYSSTANHPVSHSTKTAPEGLDGRLLDSAKWFEVSSRRRRPRTKALAEGLLQDLAHSLTKVPVDGPPDAFGVAQRRRPAEPLAGLRGAVDHAAAEHPDGIATDQR